MVVTQAIAVAQAEICPYACGTCYEIPYAMKFIQSQRRGLQLKATMGFQRLISTLKYNSIFVSYILSELCGRFDLNGLAHSFCYSYFFYLSLN